ncbi:MAG: glucosidase [Planctomycetota bacterium]
MARRPLAQDPESERLAEDARRERNWKRWGTYLPERQWGTVREDYSAHGDAWNSFPHDHARSRAYRWGEDGLLGWTDRQCRVCFAPTLWNGRDPILKERLFGLTGPEGNHGEDAKEVWHYLDATPTHSYARALYKYPQRSFPYSELVRVNRERSREEPEYELADTGAFEDDRYFDVFVEYAKAGPDDTLVRITVVNCAKEAAPVWLLPTVWFRNTWSWGKTLEDTRTKPGLRRESAHAVLLHEESLGRMRFVLDPANGPCELAFTENETNTERLFGAPNATPFTKDAFHALVVRGERDAVNAAEEGTKAAAVYHAVLAPREARTFRARLAPADAAVVSEADVARAFGADFDALFATRREECDRFHAATLARELSTTERDAATQALAGLLWSKKFYHYAVDAWLEGDPAQPAPPAERKRGRNRDWRHLYNRDVLSMPDAWEYPWYAAWDLAFHMLPMARVDPRFAKDQLLLLLREWYQHPSGQIPAYEWAFGDVNPPVHAWACWRVYKTTAPRGFRDVHFLERCFHKLLINFTWWVNRKDPEGNHVFSGGFLGLDNIGLFDRSRPLPGGHHLTQADGTAWMAFYCSTMLAMALELARVDPAYEDVASKFFEHYVAICDAMNRLGGSGLWDEDDGFYYDQLSIDGRPVPLRVRSMVGIIPLFAVEILHQDLIDLRPGFKKRMEWFLEHRSDLAHTVSYMERGRAGERLLAIPTRERLERVLRYVLDEREFLSPFGVRSLSRFHAEHPFELEIAGEPHRVDYQPGESTTSLFGGNSNWRGPVWFPVNYLLIEALERYHHFFGDAFQVEFPTGSGVKKNLREVAEELSARLARLFLPDEHGFRPCHGDDRRYAREPRWRELVSFHEYFHAETGRGLGASHQTGWTALALECLEALARARARGQNARAEPKPALPSDAPKQPDSSATTA